MKLTTPRQRERLRFRLTDGTKATRHIEAQKALPLLEGALEQVHDRKDAARHRYLALREVSGKQSDAMPVVNPALSIKIKALRLWAPVILMVEIALASYTAMLTISGGWAVHLIAGVLATALLCGLGKVAVTAQIDSERIATSAHQLERQLRLVVLACGLLLVAFFIARFLPQAETVFAIASTGLSFLVAYLAALCFTLGGLLNLSQRELTLFTQLTWAESDLKRLLHIAETNLSQKRLDEPYPAESPNRRGSLTAVLLLLCCLLAPMESTAAPLIPLGATPSGVTLSEVTLLEVTLWVDVSGSLDVSEWERVRGVLANPEALLTAAGSNHVSLATFATEMSILAGVPNRWHFPAFAAPECDVPESLFAATHKAKMQACDEMQTAHKATWQKTQAAKQREFRTALHGINVANEAPQTCLYPLLESRQALIPFEVTKIQRQRVRGGEEPLEVKQYREAVKHLSEGDPVQGLAALEQLGAITELDGTVSPNERYQQIAADYLALTQSRNLKGKPNEVLVVSPTHAEGNAVTEQIRQSLKQAGKLSKQERTVTRLHNVQWTEAERGDAEQYRPGLVIQLHQNVKGGFIRGERFTVVEDTLRSSGAETPCHLPHAGVGTPASPEHTEGVSPSRRVVSHLWRTRSGGDQNKNVGTPASPEPRSSASINDAQAALSLRSHLVASPRDHVTRPANTAKHGEFGMARSSAPEPSAREAVAQENRRSDSRGNQIPNPTLTVKDSKGKIRELPLSAACRFSVYEERPLPLAKGDRLRITQNGFTTDGKHRLNNGTVYGIKSVSAKGIITLENGWKIGSDFGHVAHGYVSTSHSSQGKTADAVLVAQSTQSLTASSLEQFYVSVSRGTEQVRIYTDDTEALRDTVSRSGMCQWI